LVIYGIHGVVVDDLFLPGKRSGGIHLHGAAALTMFFAFLCACSVMISSIVDHYDTRDNEGKYKTFAVTLTTCGWVLFFVAILFELVGARR
jgi:hypothetical protein